MRLPLALLSACAALTACGGRDYAISSRKAEIHAEPALVEWPLTPIGESSMMDLTLVHDSGPNATIRAVEIQPMLGDAFHAVTATPFTLDIAGEATFTIAFSPTVRGPGLARLVFVSDAETSRITLDLRGTGAEADARLWPSRLDFGPITDTRQRTAHLDNTGDLPFTVTSIAVEALPDASVDVTLPATVEPGMSLDLPVNLRTTLPLETTLSVVLDRGAVEPIAVVANRCELGGSSDFDGDGVSACAGDCDDTAASVYPGATEIADGLDQDCDTLVDEATAAYDDDRDGSTEEEGDCDDREASRHPHAAEEPNGVDDDCDTKVDEGTRAGDDDDDGYTEDGGDCDDANPEISPAKLEIPENAIDDDCDGVTR